MARSKRQRLMFSEETEQAVLSAMLASPSAILSAAEILKEEYFGEERHRVLFSAMVAMTDARRAVEPLALSEYLDKDGLLPLAGGKDYIGFLIDCVVGDAHVREHALIVREYHERRRLQELGYATAEAAAEGTASPQEIEERLRTALDESSDLRAEERVYDNIIEQAGRVYSFLAEDSTAGLPFGMAALDRAIVPILPGNLVELGAASGAGKSTVARNWVRNWVAMGKKVALLSFEMTADEQLLMFGCMDTGIDSGKVITRDISYDQRMQLARAVKDWEVSGRLVINDRGDVTPRSCLNMAKRYVSQGCEIVVIDHMHRVDYGEAEEDQIRLRAGAFARDLKNFAKEHRVPVIALVQLVKMSPADEPSNANIRESAKIIEEADKIIFAWRPEVACRRHELSGEAIPLEKEGGFRYFKAHDKLPAGAHWASDNTRIYLKPGKQRVRPKDGLVAIRFDPGSTRMYNRDPREQDTYNRPPAPAQPREQPGVEPSRESPQTEILGATG